MLTNALFQADEIVLFPLRRYDRKALPIHFLSRAEAGREDAILRTYLDVGVTDSGLLVAQQRIAKPPLLVAQVRISIHSSCLVELVSIWYYTNTHSISYMGQAIWDTNGTS